MSRFSARSVTARMASARRPTMSGRFAAAAAPYAVAATPHDSSCERPYQPRSPSGAVSHHEAWATSLSVSRAAGDARRPSRWIARAYMPSESPW